MTETPETTTTVPPVAPAEEDRRNTRLYRALAWVGIVAGVLLIIGAVFFAGFFVARASGGYGWHRGWQGGQMQPGGPMGGGCPMMQMQPGGMAQGGMGPGMPGGIGPGATGGMGPGRTVSPTSTPSMPMRP